MIISGKTVLQKIQAELDGAKAATNERAALLQHVANIRLLCELVLDENENNEHEAEQAVTPERIIKPTDLQADYRTGQTPADDDGTSIFDF